MPATLKNIDEIYKDIARSMEFTSHNPDLKKEANRITTESNECYNNIKNLLKEADTDMLVTGELKTFDSIRLEAANLLSGYLKDSLE